MSLHKFDTRPGNIAFIKRPNIAEIEAVNAQMPIANFYKSVPAATRQTFLTQKFTQPFFLQRFDRSFALNTQRYLRLRFWITPQVTIADDVQPEGMNLLGHFGDEDYIVGDGETTRPLQINRMFPPGFRIAVDADNQDGANAHTLDVQVYAWEILRYTMPGF